MMKTFGSVSITSHRSSDSVSSEATDEVWSPEPSSGYCSADDEHPSYDLRTPTRTTPGRSLSESSGGISSRSLLSLSLSEALSLTFCESPPPSPPPPPPPHDVLPFQDLVDSRSPGSSIDYESSLSSAVPTPSNDEFPPRIISFQPDIVSFLGRLQPCTKRNSYFEKHCRAVAQQTVTKVASHNLPSDDIQTDLLSIEINSVQDPSEDSRSHKKIRLQHTSCSEENNDLSNAIGSQMTEWSSRSCSIHLRKNATIDEVRKEQCEIPAALVSLQFDGSIVEEESVANDDAVCLLTADEDLRKLLPIADVQRSSDGKPVSTTPSHRLPAGPRIEPRRNFDASSSPEHSTDLFDEEDFNRFSHDDFDREFSATDCYQAPHFSADTNSTSSTTTPTSSPTPIISTTSMESTTSTGSTSCIVPTVSKGYNNSVDLKAFRIAVRLFHSYAAVKETPDLSCHSATSPSCSPQLHDLGFIGHDAIEDLSYDPMLPDAQTTLPGHSRDLHDGSMSTTNEEVLQDPIDDACNVVHESSRYGNAFSLSTDSMQRIASSKRSRSSSSYRQSSKRRRRHSSSALAELADHGYALKAAACDRPASLHRSSTSPCVAAVEEEESTADVSSVLAKLLLTEERLFPNEGSAGFIARRHCGQESAEDSAKSQKPSGGQGMSSSLLERLLTGQMDREEIEKSEERVIRDRMEARPDSDDVADEEDVDLQLQDFDPGSLELENLEELWKNHGDLLGKFLA